MSKRCVPPTLLSQLCVAEKFCVGAMRCTAATTRTWRMTSTTCSSSVDPTAPSTHCAAMVGSSPGEAPTPAAPCAAALRPPSIFAKEKEKERRREASKRIKREKEKKERRKKKRIKREKEREYMGVKSSKEKTSRRI